MWSEREGRVEKHVVGEEESSRNTCGLREVEEKNMRRSERRSRVETHVV